MQSSADDMDDEDDDDFESEEESASDMYGYQQSDRTPGRSLAKGRKSAHDIHAQISRMRESLSQNQKIESNKARLQEDDFSGIGLRQLMTTE